MIHSLIRYLNEGDPMNRTVLVCLALALAVALLCAGWTWDDVSPLAASWNS
jgi:hypothetical protein